MNKYKFASDGDSKTSECNNCPAASLSQPRGENNLLLTKIWSSLQDHTDQYAADQYDTDQHDADQYDTDQHNADHDNSDTRLPKMMPVILLTCNACVIWWS